LHYQRIGPFERLPLPKPQAANLSWSMDLVSDGLADGRRLRCLTDLSPDFEVDLELD
jgi:hypothetical protein